MYRCEHFRIEELVSRRVFLDKAHKAWRFFAPELLRTADKLRKRYGPAECNTWVFGGDIQYRGLRLGDEYLASSAYSGHRHGKSLDLVFADVTAEEIRADILKFPDHEDFQFITELELGVSWVHFACCTNVERILTYKP